MPEKKGTVTGFIQKKDGTIFGLNLDGEEYLYSFPDKRGEPWEAGKLDVGDTVRIEHSPYEKDGKTKQYIAVIERLGGPTEVLRGSPEPREWGWEHKDRLTGRESFIKSAVAIFAACITAGIYQSKPEPNVIIAYAEAFEKWAMEAVD